MNDDTEDATKLARARAHLDDATESIDARTQAALVQARVRAADAVAARRRRYTWGGTGLGLALAASLAVVVVVPRNGAQAPAEGTIADVLAEQDIVLAGDDEAAIADDMAFVAWLEENPDA